MHPQYQCFALAKSLLQPLETEQHSGPASEKLRCHFRYVSVTYPQRSPPLRSALYEIPVPGGACA